MRSPLASIKGYTGTLLRHERRISAEERHEFLLAIQEERPGGGAAFSLRLPITFDKARIDKAVG